jgi:hypothetical protein
MNAGQGARRFTLDLVLAPVPSEVQVGPQALDQRVADHLKALGYLDE